MQSNFPAATPHGEIREISEDVFIVTGSVMMVPQVQISRNIIILREGEALTLISAFRLNEEGLKALDTLGRVNISSSSMPTTWAFTTGWTIPSMLIDMALIDGRWTGWNIAMD